MGTVPTSRLERELRKLYLRWLVGLPQQQDVAASLADFERRSRELIRQLGGQVASLGALTDFPVPKTLELSPHAGTIYREMEQAAISASITAGLNSRDAARQMLNAGLDKGFNRLSRLARTETVSAYWKNSWDSVADLPAIVMVWSAEHGPRTCDWCLSREGLVVADQNIRDHPNGRCTLVAKTRSMVDYKGTLQPDGSITQDPEWHKGKPKADAAMKVAPATPAAETVVLHTRAVLPTDLIKASVPAYYGTDAVRLVRKAEKGQPVEPKSSHTIAAAEHLAKAGLLALLRPGVYVLPPT